MKKSWSRSIRERKLCWGERPCVRNMDMLLFCMPLLCTNTNVLSNKYKQIHSCMKKYLIVYYVFERTMSRIWSVPCGQVPSVVTLSWSVPLWSGPFRGHAVVVSKHRWMNKDGRNTANSAYYILTILIFVNTILKCAISHWDYMQHFQTYLKYSQYFPNTYKDIAT